MSMKMRSFGKLGISGSAFGLGCMRFPMVEKAVSYTHLKLPTTELV